jgi:hypothetical protein
MDITINTPALVFPAISLVLLAYTNRFLALASVVRKLNETYLQNKDNKRLQIQIKSIHYRIKLVRRMQFFGVISFLLSIICMFLIYLDFLQIANYIFGLSLLSFSWSLVFSLIEITQSTKALEIMLNEL